MPRSPELLFRRESLDGVPSPRLEFGYLVRTARPGDENAWHDLAEGRRLLGLSTRDFAGTVLHASDFDPRGLVFVTIGSRPAGIAYGVRPLAGRRVGRLRFFAVKPSHRGKGIGRFLVWKVIEYLKSAGCTSCEVKIRRSQTHARSLLNALGFVSVDTPTGRRKENRCRTRKQPSRART